MENIKIINLLIILKEYGHVWHLFVNKTENRTDLQKKLSYYGIQTLNHYPILPHKQFAYKYLN